jgi:omega-6 fatty acid desaturase (delta-12 desaturase)
MYHGMNHHGPNAREVRAQLDGRHRNRAFMWGLLSFLSAGFVWLVTLAAIGIAPWWAKAISALLNAMAIGILFIIGHDACHGALLPRRGFNRLIGKLCLLPALHPYLSWVHNHNGLHHGFTNIKEKDPGFPPLSMTEYAALPAWRRWLYRCGRTWYGLGLLYFTDMWLKWEVMPRPSRTPRNLRVFRRDRRQVQLFALGWIGFLVAAALWQGESVWSLVLIGFVVPQVIWNWFIGFITLQQHTHPHVPWYSELDRPSPSFFQTQVQATPHLVFPAPFRYLMRHVMEHTAHHADPAVPLYRLSEAQEDLKDAYAHDMITERWTVWSFFRTLRTCRLYDFEFHRWIDYDGTPLGDPLVVKLPLVKIEDKAA